VASTLVRRDGLFLNDLPGFSIFPCPVAMAGHRRGRRDRLDPTATVAPIGYPVGVIVRKG
jgi:hypothetical protein